MEEEETVNLQRLNQTNVCITYIYMCISNKGRERERERERMKALLVIDLQNDFANQRGSMYVDKSEEIIEPIIELVKDKEHRYRWDRVVFTRDWHPVDHISFARTHGLPDFCKYTYHHPRDTHIRRESTLWPVHCVQGTWGSQLVDPIRKELITTKETENGTVMAVVDKGFIRDREFYSAFDDIWGESSQDTSLEDQLLEGIQEIYVVGLALDYCVKNTAISAATRGYKTTVLKEYTRAIHTDPAAMESLCRELKEHGVSLI